MSNPNGRKGSQFETDLVRFLQERGFPNAERRVREGANDRGDVAGVPGVVFEAKNVQRIELSRFVEEAERERANAGALLGVTVIKRRGKGVADAYCVVPLHAFVTLIGGD